MKSREGVAVVGTGSDLPVGVVTNEVVAHRAGTTEEWIAAKTGIHRRWYAAPNEATSDLGAHAALDDAGVTADQVRWIILATSTPDHPQPPTACLVQMPASAATLTDGQHRFRLRGRAVGEFVRLELPLAVEGYDVPAKAVTHFIPHQANGSMLRAVESVGTALVRWGATRQDDVNGSL